MQKNAFEFDEAYIREAADKDPLLFQSIKEEFYALRAMMKKIIEEREERMRREAKEKHAKDVRLARGGTVFYVITNNWPEVPYGSKVIKTRTAGRSYCYCRVPHLGKEKGKQEYRLAPEYLSFSAPEEGQIKTNRQLVKLLSNFGRSLAEER